MPKSRILIVEDEYLVAKALEKELVNRDYDVPAISVSGRDAIKQVKKHKPDLILIDIILKGKMDGIETAGKIRETCDIPIIYITAYDDPLTLEKAKITDPVGYLMKPVDEKQLFISIEMALYKHNLDKAKEELLNKLHQSNTQLQKEINERMKVEKALRESEKKFRSLFESAPEFIQILDMNCTILQINSEVTLRSGYTEDEIVGRNFKEFLTPSSQEIFTRELPILIANGILFAEVEFVCKDGTFIDVDCACSVVYNDRKEIEYIVMFQRDITERKRAEEELHENERRFRELAELLPQSIFELDMKGNFTYSNRNGFESTGYTREDMEKGVNALQLFIPEDRKRVGENIDSVLRSEKLNGHEFTLLRKDGSTFPALIYTNPIIRDNKPAGIRGIVLDISEHKNKQNTL